VVLRDLKMAQVYVKLKVMPASPETDLEALKEACKQKIKDFGGNIHEIEELPIAFGLTALIITFAHDEKKGTPDALENDIANLEQATSAEAIDVRRAIG
jgi:elongation factor 1-beta